MKRVHSRAPEASKGGRVFVRIPNRNQQCHSRTQNKLAYVHMHVDHRYVERETERERERERERESIYPLMIAEAGSAL